METSTYLFICCRIISPLWDWLISYPIIIIFHFGDLWLYGLIHENGRSSSSEEYWEEIVLTSELSSVGTSWIET